MYLVVELEHVREQHDRAAVGAVQLERCAVALAPVRGEDLEQPDERAEGQQRERRGGGGHGDEEGDRREDRVDARDACEEAEHLAHRHAVDEVVADDHPGEVAGELRDVRERVGPGDVDGGELGCERREDEHGADAEPAVAECGDRAVPVPGPAYEVGDDGEHRARGDHRGDQGKRGEGEHRHEQELLGHDVGVAELEADARYERVADHEAEHHEHVHGALVRKQRGEGGERQDEGHRREAADECLARWHLSSSALARLADHLSAICTIASSAGFAQTGDPRRDCMGSPRKPPSRSASFRGNWT